MLLAGAVMDIPFTTDVLDATSNISYTNLFDNGTSASIPLSEMASLIPACGGYLVREANDLFVPFDKVGSSVGVSSHRG